MARRSKVQRESDLVTISDLYLRGITQAEIAQTLNISQPSISNDLRELQKRWQAKALHNIDQLKAEELAKIDKLERTYWEAWERSCQDAEFMRQKGKPGDTKPVEVTYVEKTTKGQTGNPQYLAGVQWCIEKRCKILGLDANPPNQNLNIDLENLSDEQLDRIIAGESVLHVIRSAINSQSHTGAQAAQN